MTAVLGGTCGAPIAERVIESTTTIFRKEVSITSAAGTTASAARTTSSSAGRSATGPAARASGLTARSVRRRRVGEERTPAEP